MKKYIPWVVVLLAILGVYAYGDLKRELDELLASESSDTDSDEAVLVREAVCTEGSTRCQGNTVQRCVDNGWKPWTDE